MASKCINIPLFPDSYRCEDTEFKVLTKEDRETQKSGNKGIWEKPVVGLGRSM